MKEIFTTRQSIEGMRRRKRPREPHPYSLREENYQEETQKTPKPKLSR